MNKFLKKHSLKEVATKLGYKYSTFTTEMRNGGEYQFIKKNKQYIGAVSLGDKVENENNDRATAFIIQNRKALQHIIEMYQSNNLLLLDEQVYSKKATFENKSIKMNKDIYKNFSEFCEANYPHLKIQDLIAKALLDFTKRYKR